MANFEGAPIEDADTRWKRYVRSRDHLNLWQDIIEDAYELTLPVRNRFDKPTPGEPRTNRAFDSTAVRGVKSFSNNIQSILTPPFKRWGTLIPGHNVSDNQKEAVETQLEAINDKIYRYFDQSNFAVTINESYQDMSISTGILIMNEGTVEKPFEFRCVPFADVAFEEGTHGKLENFWRLWEIPVRQLRDNWPDANLTDDLQRKLESAPHTLVRFIEGTITYPQNDEGKQIFYYLQLEEGQTDMIQEWMDFNPWNALRMNVVPGDIIGWGPVLTNLNSIQVLNKMAEFELKIASFRAFPPYTVPNAGTMNPYTMRIEPGAFVPIEPNFVGQKPIDLIPQPGDVQFGQLSIESLQSDVRDGLFAQPLGPVTGGNTSATEISTRQANWLRESTAAFGRLTSEVLQPLINTALRILHRKGLIEPIEINGQKILEIDGNNLNIEFESPLFEVQNQEDFQRLDTLAQTLIQDFGPEGIGALQVEKIPAYMAEKLGVPLRLVKNPSEVEQALSNVNQQQQQQSQAAAVQAGEQAPPTPSPVMDDLMTNIPTQGS